MAKKFTGSQTSKTEYANVTSHNANRLPQYKNICELYAWKMQIL